MNRPKTFIVGHRNPDTDSICSAISYAYLKNYIEGSGYEARRAGEPNEETKYVLNYFGVEAPKLIENVKTQIKDIEIWQAEGVNKNITLKKAWTLMSDANDVTLPAVDRNGKLEGLITIGDIAKSYMNIHDSHILSMANTRYSNIIETLEGLLIVGDEDAYFKQGKVLIAAANPDMMEYYIEDKDLVILGNRYESQLCAIEMGASCIIVCEGAGVSKTIQKLAGERGVTIITTAYDTFMVARLITQSMPISYFMTKENIITFQDTDYLDDIKEVMATVRHRYFPVIDKNGKYKGMISRRNLLGATGKQLILVDHNEKSQAVFGMEHANILEIIDHHRLGTVETLGPVYFRAQPLGCTATIIYQMYGEKCVKIPKHIAGLLCSAIISDTLLFRSPTCTPMDKEVALKLADIAGIDIEKYANDMFAAASNLAGKTDDEILHQDYKKFTLGKTKVAVGQISSLNEKELDELEKRLMPYIEEVYEVSEEDMIFFMLTNILEQNTRLVCIGSGAVAFANKAFNMETKPDVDNNNGTVHLNNVVSRKKQLMPALALAAQQ
jgi:inorganic diphosphatase